MATRKISTREKLDLARDAMQATIDVRFKLGAGLEEPICAYSACERLGVPVRFVDVSMEGIYSHKPLPRILVSALRPLVRRHFNCAHEFGHFVFGHSSKLDELKNTMEEYGDLPPEEFIVDSFAGHLLMPVLGIRRAFARRKIEAATALPHQIFAIASEFHVSFNALITQLAFCINEISKSRRTELMKSRQSLQRSLVSTNEGRGLAYLDDQYAASTLDVEENYLIVAPTGSVASDNDCIVKLGTSEYGNVFRVLKRGIVELFVPNTSWHVSVRSTKENFIGLARYRYLEDGE